MSSSFKNTARKWKTVEEWKNGRIQWKNAVRKEEGEETSSKNYCGLNGKAEKSKNIDTNIARKVVYELRLRSMDPRKVERC